MLKKQARSWMFLLKKTSQRLWDHSPADSNMTPIRSHAPLESYVSVVWGYMSHTLSV